MKRKSRTIFACGVIVLLVTTVLPGCGANRAVPSTGSITNPVTSASKTDPDESRLPSTEPPPAPLSDYPILGYAYNPPDPGQPADSFYIDAYELRPNLMIIKAGTWVTWVNVDNKPFFVESVDNLFFGITSPLGLSWSYQFDSPGTFAFTISPYNATEIGVVVVTQ
jgi:hypothetical protein